MTTTQTRSLSEVVQDFRFAMLVTADQTARPLTVQEVDEDIVRFLVSSDADWTDSADGSAVLLALSDPKGNSFASVTGIAAVIDNRTISSRLYGGASGAFFDGPDDPTLRVLEVRATSGEWWDGPSGRIGSALSVVKAAAGADASKTGTIDLS